LSSRRLSIMRQTKTAPDRRNSAAGVGMYALMAISQLFHMRNVTNVERLEKQFSRELSSINMLSREDVEKIIERLYKLKPGEKIIYFTGFLEYSRSTDPYGSTNRIAGVAYDLATSRRILLTQRRLSAPIVHGGYPDWVCGIGRGFDYIATGAHPRSPRQIPLARIFRKGGQLDTSGLDRNGKTIDGGVGKTT
jgi:hypothetical protein